MWDLVQTFNMYDPMALLASIPTRRAYFFEAVVRKDDFHEGVEHLIIGIDKETTGISSKSDDLHDFLLTSWIRAAGRPREGVDVEEARPEELDSEDFTAALDPMITHSEEQMEKLNANVLGLLENEWPRLCGSSLAQTWRDRDQFMRAIDGPPMLVLDWVTVLRLGRIPHSAENRGLSLSDAFEIADKEEFLTVDEQGAEKKIKMRFFIEMFSHRWSSRFTPDDRWNSKARALVEWGRYRQSMGLRTFFWVDYCCINQGDIAPGVAMLPLYVSSCNNIVCYDTPPYEPRSWCRVERLLFAAFVAPNCEFLNPEFVFDPETADWIPNSKEIKPVEDGRGKVPDPDGPDSQLSYDNDRPLISELIKLCKTHWAKTWKPGLKEIVKTKMGLEGIDELTFGTTELRLRRYGPGGWTEVDES